MLTPDWSKLKKGNNNKKEMTKDWFKFACSFILYWEMHHLDSSEMTTVGYTFLQLTTQYIVVLVLA